MLRGSRYVVVAYVLCVLAAVPLLGLGLTELGLTLGDVESSAENVDELTGFNLLFVAASLLYFPLRKYVF